jgi:ATP-dependent protease ClpP protease subunit
MVRFDLAGVIKEPDPFYEMYFGEPEPGCTGITALKKFLSETQDTEVELVINSPGGDAQMGLDMHDALVLSGKTIHVRVEGICYSAATPSLLSAKKENRSMTENSSIGIHLPYIPPYTLADSYTADELQSLADGMRVFEELYINMYADGTGQTVEALRELMVAETIMAGEQATALGFVSTVIKTNITNFKQLKAVAFINPNSNNMNPEIQEKISGWDKFIEKANAFFDKFKPAAEVVETTPEPVLSQEQFDTLTAENETLKAKITELETAQTEATAKIAEIDSVKAEFETMKVEVESFKSNFKPTDRIEQQTNAAKSYEDRKAELINLEKERKQKN